MALSLQSGSEAGTTVGATQTKDRSGCAPVFGSGNGASDDVYQKVAEQQEKAQQSLLESEQDSAAASEVVRQQRERVVSTYVMSTRLQEMQRQKAHRAQDEEGSEATLKQRYPRRWYDSIMPFQPPWDSRPTVGEVRERLEAQTNNAAWRIERKARTTDHNSVKAGTIVFWLVVLVLAAAPILARATTDGPIAPMCFESESSECEVVPYPRIAVYCALAIVVLFKACSVDMTCGPWGAMPPMFTPAFGRTSSLDFVQQEGQHAVPRVLTGAVPESDRQGVYGYLERLCAVWHGCLGSFAVGVLILLDLGRHMRDDYALTTLSGKPVEKGAVILARPGTLDQEDVDLSRCLAMMQEDLLVVAGEFFGMRNLVLFMSGAILFGIGELFKLRAVQDFPAKGFFGMEVFLRISKPWVWSASVFELKDHADDLAVNLRYHSHQAAKERLQTMSATPASSTMVSQSAEATPLMETVESIDQGDADGLRALAGDMRDLAKRLMDRSSYNIGQINFWRVAWAAAFQMAGVALWVPASQAELEPCLHQTERWSVANHLVEDAVDKAEIISFGSVCVLIATLCFLVYLPSIPFELASFSAYNPSNWIVKIATLEKLWKDFRPEVWLRLVVDGLLLVYVFDAIFFGQLGAPWGRWDSLSTWWSDFWKYDLKEIPFNPWIIWRFQVMLYAAELATRWFGNNFVSGCIPSEAEEAVYVVQVQDMLLEILHQVADAGGSIAEASNEMTTMSADLQVKVFEEYQKAKEIRTKEHEYGDLAEEDQERGTADSLAPAGSHQRQRRSADGRQLQEFIVDNRWLKAQTDGLSYRNTKFMEDQDITRPVAPWFSVVFGYDEEDGWVKLEDGSYLPSFVNDVPVLTVPQDEQ